MPRRRLLIIAGLLSIGLLLFLFSQYRAQYMYQGEIATQKATGLGAVAPSNRPLLFGFLQTRNARVAGVIGGVATEPVTADPEQVIHTAELSLLVRNVDNAASKLRAITLEHGGEIDEIRLWSPSEDTRAGELRLRVPAGDMHSDLSLFKQVAVKVTGEQIRATDVTRQYADNEAHMRNIKAEEQQYLLIMRQAKTVKDTLEVAGKLSDVRGRIESLQAEINVMTHDIAMSQVTISLAQEGNPSTLSWRPLQNARTSLRSLASGLAGWADAMVTVIIILPVILLWVSTLGATAFLVWRAGRWLWHLRPRTVPKLQP